MREFYTWGAGAARCRLPRTSAVSRNALAAPCHAPCRSRSRVEQPWEVSSFSSGRLPVARRPILRTVCASMHGAAPPSGPPEAAGARVHRSRRVCATLMRPQLRPTLRAKRLGPRATVDSGRNFWRVAHASEAPGSPACVRDRAAQAAARVSPAVGLLRTARRVGVGWGDHAVTVAPTCSPEAARDAGATHVQ